MDGFLIVAVPKKILAQMRDVKSLIKRCLLLQMPVNPQAQALLKWMAQHTIPSPEYASMPEVRAAVLNLSR